MAHRAIRARIFKMSINPATGEVDLLVRLISTDLHGRNALHQAMKHGNEIAVAVECEREGPVYEALPLVALEAVNG